VAALFDNLEDGASVKDFLEWFPGVAPSKVEGVLNTKGGPAHKPRSGMKVLFDHGTPVPLRRFLPGMKSLTAYEMAGRNWRTLTLLAAAGESLSSAHHYG